MTRLNLMHAYKLPLYANQHNLTPIILKCGSVEKNDATDNSPISNVDTDPYLFISIRGNDKDPDDSPQPDETILQQRSPIIEYTQAQSGGVFSPVSTEETNYLVFSGKILLLPRVWECDRFLNVKLTYPSEQDFTTAYKPNWGIYSAYDIESEKKDTSRYYTRKFYKDNDSSMLSDMSDIAIDGYPYYDYHATFDNLMLWPEDKGKKQLNYKFSATGNGNDNQRDKIWKLPILECELIIGNKRLVEYDMDEWGHSKFKWVDINEGVDQSYTDENGVEQTYSKQTFSLGINPKTDGEGDYIIGQEFNLQNTVNYTMNIDGKGTAIPITADDALSGKVNFKILGPINLTYDQITRRHPTWFRHTKWSSTSKSVLSHLESIIIKDFEAKIYSSGSADDFGDNDLIYVSDETDRYISKNDDTTFKFITQLTKAESIEKGISPSINQNAVVDMTSNLPLRSIYNANTATTAKPEEHYVDQYYRIFSTPKITMETTLHDNDINFEYQYESNGINKESYVLGISRNLKMNTVTVKLKSIE